MEALNRKVYLSLAAGLPLLGLLLLLVYPNDPAPEDPSVVREIAGRSDRSASTLPAREPTPARDVGAQEERAVETRSRVRADLDSRDAADAGTRDAPPAWPGPSAATERVSVPPTPVVEISGIVTTERGDPIAGETVHLRSKLLNAEHRVETDEYGEFVVSDVNLATDYYLWIHPKDTYTDFSQELADLSPPGLALEIVLEPLPTGWLTGWMVDAEEQPIREASLWVWSDQASAQRVAVMGDADGYFALEAVPAGALTIGAAESPNLRIGGLTLAGNETAEVVLVLDRGDRILRGQVLSERGDPVPRAKLTLSWVHKEELVVSSSTRVRQTDESGYFEFAELGPGHHRLAVRAPGYEVARHEVEVSRNSEELSIQLHSAGR